MLIFCLMSYPKIKFKISKKKELEVFKEFFNYYKTDEERLFNWLLVPHKSFKKSFWKKNIANKQITEMARKYIDEYYKIYGKTINKNGNAIELLWEQKEKRFYNLANEVFGNYKWPKGKYIGYLTMWGIYPRYIKEKFFCLPYKHKVKNYALTVIAHEMLHFIFYSYLFKKYPMYKNKNYGMLIWHASEIFNSVVQKSKSWIKLFGLKSKIYPEHKEIIKKIDDIWRPENKISTFLNKDFLVIKKWVSNLNANP